MKTERCFKKHEVGKGKFELQIRGIKRRKVHDLGCINNILKFEYNG